MSRFACLCLVTLTLSACAGWDRRYGGEIPPPNPPFYCYETLGRAACYDTPQIGMGDLINEQLPPIAPVVVVPAAVVPPAKTIIIEQPPETLYVEHPDPYPEPGQTFTDAPIPLAPYPVR